MCVEGSNECMGDRLIVNVSLGDILTICIFIAGMVGGLGTLHYRGMLKVSEIRAAIELRLSALEATIEALTLSIHENGFAKEEDVERISEELLRVRERQLDFSNKLTKLTLRNE